MASQMREAFARAGELSPHDQAVELLKRCWEEHKPNVTEARKAFSEALVLSDISIVRAVIGEREWNNRISAFSHLNEKGIRYEIQRNNAIRMTKARIEAAGGGAAPRALYNREWARQNRGGGGKPVSEIPIADIEKGPHAQRGRQRYLQKVDRDKRGVAVARVEIDKRSGEVVTLLSKLPATLTLFAGWTKSQALTWCAQHEGDAKSKLAQVAKVRLWCDSVPDSNVTLGEQLTDEVVALLRETGG